MPKNRSISKMRKKNLFGIDSKDKKKITEMFSELVGTKNMKKNIVLSKIIDMLAQLNGIHKLLKVFKNLKVIETILDAKYKKNIKEIDNFIKEIEENFKDFDKDSHLLYFELSSNFNENDLNKLYNEYINSNVIKQIIITTKNMNEYADILKSDKPIIIGTTDKFINDRVGLQFEPFSFIDLDLKSIWFKMEDNNSGKKFFLGFMKKLYNYGYQIYDIFVRPSINIDECSELLFNTIGKLKKVIPNCNDAFKAIENSIDLFKQNFTGYYKNFVKTGDTSIILSDFISDMCYSYRSDVKLPKLTLQLEKIGKYIIARLPKKRDPKINDLIKILRTNIDIMKNKNININEYNDDNNNNNNVDINNNNNNNNNNNDDNNNNNNSNNDNNDNNSGDNNNNDDINNNDNDNNNNNNNNNNK